MCQNVQTTVGGGGVRTKGGVKKGHRKIFQNEDTSQYYIGNIKIYGQTKIYMFIQYYKLFLYFIWIHICTVFQDIFTKFLKTFLHLFDGILTQYLKLHLLIIDEKSKVGCFKMVQNHPWGFEKEKLCGFFETFSKVFMMKQLDLLTFSC